MTANRFRFRAWHPDREEMFYANHDEVIFCIDNDGIRTEEYGIRDTQGPNGEHIQDEAWQEYPCIIMQSTGLVDKNGVEIFEGDKVKLYPSDRQMMSMTVVVWVDGRLELAWQVAPDKTHIDSSNAHLRLTSLRPDFYEVVGNIYEEKQ